jgi:hypothetical protein
MSKYHPFFFISTKNKPRRYTGQTFVQNIPIKREKGHTTFPACVPSIQYKHGENATVAGQKGAANRMVNFALWTLWAGAYIVCMAVAVGLGHAWTAKQWRGTEKRSASVRSSPRATHDTSQNAVRH